MSARLPAHATVTSRSPHSIRHARSRHVVPSPHSIRHARSRHVVPLILTLPLNRLRLVGYNSQRRINRRIWLTSQPINL
jgi:hypothetical protein